jgi:hypothetical protein
MKQNFGILVLGFRISAVALSYISQSLNKNHSFLFSILGTRGGYS